uniref:RNA-directed DNA polymerase, eukaryota n=1 Tax=Tanacetum cinerariifolium TaxID=118510 RepID=A0A699IWN8_TANCI|nr:RNA-directed DNA polymerase, eukaryota [Tanacetum cinerariifolium]
MTERDGKQIPIYFVNRVLQGLKINYTLMKKLILALSWPNTYESRRSEFTYTLRFKFDTTNNEAEYEALIAGLQIAEQMGVKNLQANVDAWFVANQVNGTYIAKDPGMIKYLEKETLPADVKKARSVRRKSQRFAILNETLYKKAFLEPWLRSKRDTINELGEIDKNLDSGLISETIILRRLELKHKLLNINDMESKDYIQKSKVTWAIEGDENSKFFHGIINKKRSQLAIRGIFVDGSWCTEPGTIKKAFVNHFEARFKESGLQRFKINFQFPKKLLQNQADDLERVVSRDEIRLAVWNCGDNKSPGPDGYSFEFLKKYWDLIGSDLCEAVEYFFRNGSFSKGCNSSFITLIPKVLANRLMKVISDLVSDTQSAFVSGRQILDGPFILDELLQWCKRRNKQTMFFKVDFAKAYDSIRWDYLIDVF